MSDGYTQPKNSGQVRTGSQHTNSLYHLKTNLLEVSSSSSSQEALWDCDMKRARTRKGRWDHDKLSRSQSHRTPLLSFPLSRTNRGHVNSTSHSIFIDLTSLLSFFLQTFHQVSLYQILPKRSQSSYKHTALSTNTSQNGGALSTPTSDKETGISSEYPLRLLDIRRIDLDSSGWETFYVKRAVEDWISDASLNLGKCCSFVHSRALFAEFSRD